LATNAVNWLNTRRQLYARASSMDVHPVLPCLPGERPALPPA